MSGAGTGSCAHLSALVGALILGASLVGCAASAPPDPTRYPAPDPVLLEQRTHRQVIEHLRCFAALLRRVEAAPEPSLRLLREHFQRLPPESWMLGSQLFAANAGAAVSEEEAQLRDALAPQIAHATWLLYQSLRRIARQDPELARELARQLHSWLEPPSPEPSLDH